MLLQKVPAQQLRGRPARLARRKEGVPGSPQMGCRRCEAAATEVGRLGRWRIFSLTPVGFGRGGRLLQTNHSNFPKQSNSSYSSRISSMCMPSSIHVEFVALRLINMEVEPPSVCRGQSSAVFQWPFSPSMCRRPIETRSAQADDDLKDHPILKPSEGVPNQALPSPQFATASSFACNQFLQDPPT